MLAPLRNGYVHTVDTLAANLEGAKTAYALGK